MALHHANPNITYDNVDHSHNIPSTINDTMATVRYAPFTDPVTPHDPVTLHGYTLPA
jgi:hypothetical protein